MIEDVYHLYELYFFQSSIILYFREKHYFGTPLNSLDFYMQYKKIV